MLTEDGSYDMQLAKGHQMVIERKGGGYSFDGWFRITPPNVAGLQPGLRRHARRATSPRSSPSAASIRPEPDYETTLALMCMMSGGDARAHIEGFAAR